MKCGLVELARLLITIALFTILPIKITNAALPPILPGAPREVNHVVTPDFVQVNWIDNSLNEQRFEVTIDKSSLNFVAGPQENFTQKFTAVAIPGRGTRTAINITGLTPGRYRYWVCAKLPSGSACGGYFSFIVPGPTEPQPPTAPSNLTFSRVGASTARIFWTHPGGANSFLVRLNAPGSASSILAATVAGSERQADIAPLLVNTIYLVSVCARAISGQETCSPPINVVLQQGF